MDINIFNYRTEEEDQDICTPFFPNQVNTDENQVPKNEIQQQYDSNSEEKEIIDLLNDLLKEEIEHNN